MKEKLNNKVLFIVSLFVVVSIVSLLFVRFFSKPRYASKEEINSYIQIEENGLFKTKEEGDVKMKVLFKPSDLLLLQDLSNHPEEKQQLAKQYEENYYFIFSISKANQELESYYYITQGDINAKVQMLTFNMGKYFKIIYDKQDTIAITDYIYPRMYGSTGSSSFMLIFNNERLKKSKEFELLFNYPEFTIKDEKFLFRKEDIEKIPQLKF